MIILPLSECVRVCVCVRARMGVCVRVAVRTDCMADERAVKVRRVPAEVAEQIAQLRAHVRIGVLHSRCMQ